MRGSTRKLSPGPYPEIGGERTLGRVILENIASSGRGTTLAEHSEQVFSARFHKDRRIASISTADDMRMFISGFSCRGVQLASLMSRDLREVSRAVELWLMDELTLRDMKERIVNLDLEELSLEIEAGRGIAAHWNQLLLLLSDYSEVKQSFWFEPELGALIRAAANRPLLRQLVPKVSIGCFLFFSRTIGYPYVIAGNCGIFAGRGRCIVMTQDRRQLAEGRIEDMLDVFERVLPPDTGPAIFGTAEDLSPS